jgi:hypothetical protein
MSPLTDFMFGASVIALSDVPRQKLARGSSFFTVLRLVSSAFVTSFLATYVKDRALPHYAHLAEQPFDDGSGEIAVAAGAVGALAERHSPVRLADAAHVGDTGRGAVEILAGYQVREAARAHRRRQFAIRAQLLEQRRALGGGERVVGRGYEAHVGGENQQAHLFAEDAFDDVEAREHGRGGITRFDGLEVTVRNQRDFDLVGERRRDHAALDPLHDGLILLEPIRCFRHHRDIARLAEIARQYVA